MGKDLYYKQTPKEPQYECERLDYTTWHLLASIYEEEEPNDLDGKQLDSKDIPKLKIILETAKYSDNSDLVEDILNLITAIKALNSITLVIKD